MAVPRSEVETSLHRLANYVECQLTELIQQLLIESRPADTSTLAWSGSRFIESLREVRDGKDGGDV